MTNRREALRIFTYASVGIAAFSMGTGVLGASRNFKITMRNVDPSDRTKRMAFTPDILKVPAGSNITFEVADGAHNTQSTPGMIPDGAAGWQFGIRKTGTITLTKPGFYGYHCMPHRAMGMVGLIIVEGPGMMNNLAAAKEVPQPAKAAARWSNIWRRVERMV